MILVAWRHMACGCPSWWTWDQIDFATATLRRAKRGTPSTTRSWVMSYQRAGGPFTRGHLMAVDSSLQVRELKDDKLRLLAKVPAVIEARERIARKRH
jgi:hypothetical protein